MGMECGGHAGAGGEAREKIVDDGGGVSRGGEGVG